jgi:proline utilization trans-activator
MPSLVCSQVACDSYLRQLVAENKRLQALHSRRHGSTQQQNDADDTETDTLSPATISEAFSRSESSHGVPLDGQPWFVDIDLPHTPTPVNEAADTAFATRFRQILSDPQDPHCVHLPHIDYAGDDTIMSLAEGHSPWPKLSRARLLMSVAMLHASRGFHIVRRTAVLDALEKSFTDPDWRDPVMTCKLRALFALGDLCSSRFVPAGQQFPGLGHFAQATRILSYLGERPTLDLIEIRLLLVGGHWVSSNLGRPIYSANRFRGSLVSLLLHAQPRLRGVHAGRHCCPYGSTHGTASEHSRGPAQRPGSQRTPE